MANVPTISDLDGDGNVLIGYVIDILIIERGWDREDYPTKTHNETITWLDKDNTMLEISNPTDITDKEIATRRAELKTAYDGEAWKRSRQLDYPHWTTQLDKIYDDGVDKWKTEMVDPVKTKWPKNNSGPVDQNIIRYGVYFPKVHP